MEVVDKSDESTILVSMVDEKDAFERAKGEEKK